VQYKQKAPCKEHATGYTAGQYMPELNKYIVRLCAYFVKPCQQSVGLFRVFIFWYHARRFAATIGRDTTMNVIQALKTIPDPRRRRGRHYPLFGLLAIVLRAAMHGERS